MVTCLKRLKKALITFILVFCILFQSCYFNPEKVEAAAPDITALLNYFLSSSGAVLSNGQTVGSALNRVQDWWNDNASSYNGTGYYIDSNGNYVFSDELTSDFYNALNNNSNYDCRAISSFRDYSSSFVNGGFSLAVQSQLGTSGFGKYLIFYGDNSWSSDYYHYTKAVIVDISNITYFTFRYVDSNTDKAILEFRDNTGTTISSNIKVVTQQWTNGNFNNPVISSRTNSGITIANTSGGNQAINNNTFAEIYHRSLYDYNSVDLFYNNFPFDKLVFSNRSIILAKSVSAGNSYVSNNNRVFVSNTYTNFPSVKQSVIENNNWSQIYNNYVQKVTNNKKYYIDQSTGDIDTTKLQDLISDYGDRIYQAIESGNENIEEILSLQNDWLERIYNLLYEIYDTLQNVSNGGGSDGTVSGSTVDLSNIETYLRQMNATSNSILAQCAYIADNLPNNEQKLQQIYTILGNIYDSLQNIPPGGVTDPNKDPYAPWYPKFFGIPDTEILDTINQIEIIEQLLSGLVPLCYITGLGAVVNALGTEPVTPVFTIPVQFSNDIINVDEELEIDLEPFDDLRDIVTGGMVILFMITLGYFTIWLLKFLLDLLSKS